MLDTFRTARHMLFSLKPTDPGAIRLRLWTGNPQFVTYSPQTLITAVNNLNQVLGSMGLNTPSYNESDAVIYNMASHTLVNLNRSISKCVRRHLPVGWRLRCQSTDRA